MIIPADFMARLAALELVLRRALPSTQRGERRSPSRKGISLEFADFRGYVPGDDVRHLDWSSYARLGQLIIKLYHDEEDLRIHLLVDDSRSMATGEPSKATFARQVAAALAWIGLAHGARVSLGLLGDTVDLLPPVRGEGGFAALAARLEAEGGEARRPLHEACRDYLTAARPRGAIILVSDLLDPAGPAAVLSELQRPTTEVDIIHVLAPGDVDPPLDGELRLIDSETGGTLDLHVADAAREAYRQTARTFIAEWADACRRRGVAYAQTRTDVPLDEFLLRALVGEGLLR